GLVVEQAPPETLFHNPQHPYTKALIAAQPLADIDRPINLKLVALGAGSPETWPEAFRFSQTVIPSLTEFEPGHKVRLHV
ncbi:MAG: ABC transporter ATP-binding protein, partial [Pseudodonghicola sp.]